MLLMVLTCPWGRGGWGVAPTGCALASACRCFFFFRDGGCNNGVRVVASSPARRSPRVFFCLLVQHAVACLSVRRTRTLLENWLFLRDNPPHAVLAADMLY